MTNSKQKGARMERLLAKIFREWGYESRRTAQYCGNTGDAADVTLDYIHVEAKHQEQFRIIDWMSQAVRDAKKSGKLPAVFFKKNYGDIYVTMRLEDWHKMYDSYYSDMWFKDKMNPPEESNESERMDKTT